VPVDASFMSCTVLPNSVFWLEEEDFVSPPSDGGLTSSVFSEVISVVSVAAGVLFSNGEETVGGGVVLTDVSLKKNEYVTYPTVARPIIDAKIIMYILNFIILSMIEVASED